MNTVQSHKGVTNIHHKKDLEGEERKKRDELIQRGCAQEQIALAALESAYNNLRLGVDRRDLFVVIHTAVVKLVMPKHDAALIAWKSALQFTPNINHDDVKVAQEEINSGSRWVKGLHNMVDADLMAFCIALDETAEPGPCQLLVGYPTSFPEDKKIG